LKSDHTYWKDNCFSCDSEMVLRATIKELAEILTDNCDCEIAHDVTLRPGINTVPSGSVVVWDERFEQ